MGGSFDSTGFVFNFIRGQLDSIYQRVCAGLSLVWMEAAKVRSCLRFSALQRPMGHAPMPRFRLHIRLMRYRAADGEV
eukprot:3111119-Pyramimonas_sp.AAC.2